MFLSSLVKNYFLPLKREYVFQTQVHRSAVNTETSYYAILFLDETVLEASTGFVLPKPQSL